MAINDKKVDPTMPESRRLKVKQKATLGHPFYKAGYIFEVHPSQVPQLKERGWAVEENEDHTKVKGKMAIPKEHGEGDAETEAGK